MPPSFKKPSNTASLLKDKPSFRHASSTLVLRDTLSRLIRSAFLKNVLLVTSGGIVAHGVGYALSPIVARLFSPADFGALGSFVALSGVITSIVTLDYSQALMIPKQREEAGQVLLLSFLATTVVALVCTGACLLFPSLLLGLLHSQNLWLLPMLVLVVVAAGINASSNAWCVRSKAFKSTSGSQIVRGVSLGGLQIGFGIARTGAIGLIIATVCAEFLASLNLLRATRTDLRLFVSAARWRTLKTLAWEYRDFPIYSATQNLINALSTGLPVLLLTYYFGVATAGSYAFGKGLLSPVMSFFAGAIRQVLLQKAAEMHHQGRHLLPLYTKTTVGLFALGLLPAALIATMAPQLFVWLFEERWRVAGEFTRYLVLWSLFSCCNLPAVLFARLIRIQRTIFYYNLFILFSRVGVLVLGGWCLAATQTVALFSLLGAALNLSLILLVGDALLKREHQLGLLQARPFFQNRTRSNNPE